MQQPHQSHQWEHPKEGRVHCWGRNLLPEDAVRIYTTEGCDCEFCVSVRAGLHPRHIMCDTKWWALSIDARLEISESLAG